MVFTKWPISSWDFRGLDRPKLQSKQMLMPSKHTSKRNINPLSMWIGRWSMRFGVKWSNIWNRVVRVLVDQATQAHRLGHLPLWLGLPRKHPKCHWLTGRATFNEFWISLRDFAKVIVSSQCKFFIYCLDRVSKGNGMQCPLEDLGCSHLS